MQGGQFAHSFGPLLSLLLSSTAVAQQLCKCHCGFTPTIQRHALVCKHKHRFIGPLAILFEDKELHDFHHGGTGHSLEEGGFHPIFLRTMSTDFCDRQLTVDYVSIHLNGPIQVVQFGVALSHLGPEVCPLHCPRAHPLVQLLSLHTVPTFWLKHCSGFLYHPSLIQ